VALKKCREAKSSVQLARNEEKTARKMADALLFKMGKEKVTSECKINHLRSDQDEVLK